MFRIEGSKNWGFGGLGVEGLGFRGGSRGLGF